MQLKAERAGPYLRALAAGLHALAPHADHVPAGEAAALLAALDPALSGDLLLPAEVDPFEGMPALPWVQRAIAEQRLAREGRLPDAAAIARAERSDPALAERLSARRRLWEHLLRAALLPISRVEAVPRRVGRTLEISLRFDHITPAGWERLRLELAGPGGGAIGPLVLEGSRVRVGAGVRHFLARHGGLPLHTLLAQVEAALHARVLRISRGRVGPFWFPGVALPPGLPGALARGLVLHLSAELLATDVARSAHRDPLLQPPSAPPPPGYGRYTERRFAASPELLEPLRAWAEARGVQAAPVSLVPLS